MKAETKSLLILGFCLLLLFPCFLINVSLCSVAVLTSSVSCLFYLFSYSVHFIYFLFLSCTLNIDQYSIDEVHS